MLDREFFIWFLLCFSVYVIDVCFCFVLWRWRWVVALFRLCDLVWKSWIWFFFWIEDLGYLVLSVVLLDAYLQSTWLVFILMFLERVRCIDAPCEVSSRSSYLKNFILHGCFLRRWWTLIDFYCVFIHRYGLRLKFQDHCEFVDSVHNWLLWLERTFIACWYFEGSCWDLIRLCVSANNSYAYLNA